jgi:hypothetical protein
MVLRRVPTPLGATLPLASQCAQGRQRGEWRGWWEGEEGQGKTEEVRAGLLPMGRPVTDQCVIVNRNTEPVVYAEPPADDGYLAGDPEYYNSKRKAPMSDDDNDEDYGGQ